MLPLVTFPRRYVYFPTRLNPLVPNNHPATGIPANEVTMAVPVEAVIPHTQLAPKKNFASGLGVQQKLTPARVVVQALSTHIVAFPALLRVNTESVSVSTAVGATLDN